MSTRDTGKVIGLAALSALVISVSAWIAYVRHHQDDAQPAAAIPAITAATGNTRLRQDAWSLPDDGMLGFVEIPAGPFTMGSDPSVDERAFETERWSKESLQGRIELPRFFMSRYEVTVAQFRCFVESAHYASDTRALTSPADHPVTFVSLTDAVAYTQWLTSELKNSASTPIALKELLNAGWVVTVPDEAQWEKAARGVDGRIYPWGNLPNHAYANVQSNALRPVGSLPCSACAHGISDMSGNVWEMTRSPYQPYPFDYETQRGNASTDALFVMRGGSYNDNDLTSRTATRGGVDPGARREFIGFRVALVAPK